MPTVVTSALYSNLLVGQKEDVSDDLVQLIPSQTPFLNSIGFPGHGIAYNLTHSYLDDAYVPSRALLNGAILSSDTTIVFATAVFKPLEYVEIQGETIKLGTSSDRLTFTGCTRSVGTAAAAGHASGVPAYGLGKAEVQSAAAGSADTAYEPRTVTNYCQKWEFVSEVPDETNYSQRYGRPGTAYDDDVIIKMRDMKVKLEESAIWGTAVAPVGSSGTAGCMAGLVERVVGTNTTAMAAGNFTQSSMRTAVEGIGAYYDPDMNINAVLLCPIHQTFVFDGWEQAHVVVSPGDPLVQTYGVNVRRLRIGPMLIDVIGSTRLYDAAVLYQPNFIKWKFYNGMSPKHEILARDGTRTRGLTSCCATEEVYCPEAHWVFTGLAVS